MSDLPRIDKAPLLVSYLAQDNAFRGIGPKRAQALWDAFGSGVLDALRACTPEIIALIGEEEALGAAAALEIRADEARMVAWLTPYAHDIPVRQVLHLARAWGSAGFQAVQDNPYLLLAVAPWRVVDRLAQNLGLHPQDPRRVCGAIEATLQGEEGLAGGHTVVPEDLLLEDAGALLGKPLNSRAINDCVDAGGAVATKHGLQPPGAAWMERDVAETLLRLAQERIPRSASQSKHHGTNMLGTQGLSFPLTEAQNRAVEMAQQRRLFVLGGYAGSGKTTVLRIICDALEYGGRTPIIITLAGRAAQRAREATGREAMTVAKFLILHDRDDAFLRADHVVIVDEASMLSLPDVWRILRRLGNASLILAGDPGQLAPIGFGLVFHQLFDVPAIPSIVLDRVMRQSEATGIPAFAAAVRAGGLPALAPLERTPAGVSFVPCSRNALPKTLDEVLTQLGAAGITRDTVQIVAPTHREISAINTHFHRQAVRHQTPSWGPGGRFCEGEPLIWTRNISKRRLTNGSMGFLSDAQQGIAILDGNPVPLAYQDANHLELAYAISVHKAQGSQWPCVIVPVFQSRILDRALIYTALTRAQQCVIFVGERKSLNNALILQQSSTRRTGLYPKFTALSYVVNLCINGGMSCPFYTPS